MTMDANDLSRLVKLFFPFKQKRFMYLKSAISSQGIFVVFNLTDHKIKGAKWAENTGVQLENWPKEG